jgi:hypothetical protein
MQKMFLRAGLALGALVSATTLPFVSSGPAGAAYPPPIPFNTSCSVSATIPNPGSVTLTESCTFMAGSAVFLSLNGGFQGVVTAPASGQVTLTFRLGGGHLAISGGLGASVSPGTTVTVMAQGTNPVLGTNRANFVLTIGAPSHPPNLLDFLVALLGFLI